LLLHNFTENDTVNQILEIPKMRGVRVQRRTIPYKITQGGFEVKAQEQEQ
jgi:hypothetical protein